MEFEKVPSARRFLQTVYILAGILFLSWVGLQPPGPKSAQISEEQFSATRALSVLTQLEDDEAPHPVGSASNEAVRSRIVAEFAKLGYQPQVQSAFACGDYGSCANVENVVARLDGSESGPAVLLSAHYDSVAAGPGASDDLASAAAVLEIARALRSHPLQKRPIIFLIDDGEEAGLVGAKAFVSSNAWARDVKAAVNLDARGTSGESFLFETGSANDWVVQLFAHSVSRPATNSIAYTVYKLLPNDTDFSVFKRAGYQGLNFGYIAKEPQYHTPLDNVSNVNSASLQHQGENAMSAVLALANADKIEETSSDSVYFDVFGHGIAHWNARLSLRLALIATFLFAVELGILTWTKRLDTSGLMWGLLAWFLSVAITLAAALILQRLLLTTGVGLLNWVAYPIPAELTFWLLPIIVLLITCMSLARRAGFWGLWAGVWIWWQIISIVFAWRVPGFSYVPLIPSMVAVVAVIPFTVMVLLKKLSQSGTAQEKSSDLMLLLAVVLPACAGAIIGFGPALTLYDALGLRAMPGIVGLVCFLFTSAAPLCVGLRNAETLPIIATPSSVLLVLGLSIAATIVVPATSVQFPEQMNIQYWQDSDSTTSDWVVEPASGRIPDSIRAAAVFDHVDNTVPPWLSARAYIAKAPQLSLPAPTFTILQDSQGAQTRVYQALLRSERGASVSMVLFPPDSGIRDVMMGGIPVPPANDRLRAYLKNWSVYSCPDTPPEGIEMSFSLPSGRAVTVLVADRSYGLPDEGQFLLKARPLNFSPANEGDVAIVTRRVQLFP